MILDDYIYIFDLIIIVILAIDFYIRMESKQGLRFIAKHWYEIPAMLPLFVFTLIESYTVIVAAARSIRLIRLFRLIHLFLDQQQSLHILGSYI